MTPKWVIFTAKKSHFYGLYVVVLFVLFLCPIEPPLFFAIFKAIFENCRVKPPPFSYNEVLLEQRLD